MRNTLKTVIVASALVAGIVTAPALYAQGTKDTPNTQVPPTSQGDMMGHNHTVDHGNMAGQGNMMGMMGMIGQMGKIMETHNEAMQTMMDAYSAAQSDSTPSNKK